MIRLTRSHLLPIGLDLGTDGVKLLQLEVVGNQLQVVSAVRRAWSAEEAIQVRENPAAALAAALPKLLAGGHFRGRLAALNLPRSIVHMRNIRLPLMPAAELDGAVAYEVKALFGFDAAEAQVRHIPAGEVRQGTESRQEVIVIAAKQSDIASFIEPLHARGLVLDSLDVEPCALYRSVERFIRRKEDEQEVYVLAEVGACQTQVLIGKGRDIQFVKVLEMGGSKINQAVSAKLGIAPAEAAALRRRINETPESPDAPVDPIAQAVADATRQPMEELGRELALCLRYYSVTFRGQRPRRLRLLGGEGGDNKLRQTICASVGIDVECGRPLYSVDSRKMEAPLRRGTQGEWAMALGLALKRTEGHFGPRDGKPRDPNAPAEPGAAVEQTAAATGEPATGEQAALISESAHKEPVHA